MKKNLLYFAAFVVVASVFALQKFRQSNVFAEKSVEIKPVQRISEMETPPVATSKEVQNIKKEIQNPNPGIGPTITVGSKVKLEYKIKIANTGLLIAQTGNDNLPTNFQIGKPNPFGDLLMNLVGSHKGALLTFTLPPKFGVLTPTGREFAKTHKLSNDTILLIEFNVVEVEAK